MCLPGSHRCALPARTWVSHGEGPLGKQGTGSSAGGCCQGPEPFVAPSAVPAPQTLKPALATSSSLLSSQLSRRPLFLPLSGRPLDLLFFPAHPDLRTPVEDGRPCRPWEVQPSGAGGRNSWKAPGRLPAGLRQGLRHLR